MPLLRRPTELCELCNNEPITYLRLGDTCYEMINRLVVIKQRELDDTATQVMGEPIALDAGAKFWAKRGAK